MTNISDVITEKPISVGVYRYPAHTAFQELAGTATICVEVINPEDPEDDLLHSIELTAEDAIALAARLLDAVGEIARLAKHKTTRSGEPVEDLPTPCADCAIELMPDTPPGSFDWQWYMVRDEVWSAAGMDEGCLCIPCLEKRLGRELAGHDFPDLPINSPDFYEDTPRLAQLKRDSGAKAVAR